MAGQMSLFQGRRRAPKASSAPKIEPGEFPLTCQVADLLRRWARPDWRWTHFPAGELRTEATGARLKRMGTATGWPDFLLVSPTGQVHCLELKRRDGELSDAQKEFRDWCTAHDVPYVIVRTLDRAAQALNDWGAVRGKVEVQ